MKAFWLTVALAALLAPVVASADYYRYETDEGTLAFSDDLKRIPSRYRDRVQREREQSLFEYARSSIVPPAATKTVAPETLDLEAPAPAVEAAQPAPARVQIGSNPATTTIEVPAEAKEPVRIERYTEWRWVDGRYVPHAIVKKDDRIVSVTRLR